MATYKRSDDANEPPFNTAAPASRTTPFGMIVAAIVALIILAIVVWFIVSAVT